MPFLVYAAVDFTDQPGRVSTQRYQLGRALEDDFSNMTAVMTDFDDLVDALNVLTWDTIYQARAEIVTTLTPLSPNVAATNANYAFVRTRVSSGASSGEETYFIVPAWDNAVYSEDKDGMLSAAFLTAAADVAVQLGYGEDGDPVEVVAAQARERKVWKRNI